MMTIQLHPTYQALSEAAAEIIANQLKQKPNSVLCFASGDTPKLTCDRLVSIVHEQAIDVSQCAFIGLDEWVGIAPDTEGSCYKFFQEKLIIPLGLKPNQVRLFDGLAQNLQAECDATDDFIAEKGGLDIMLVGVGMNGHIGFNEPGVDETLTCHVIDLEPITTSVGQKYFTGAKVLKQGITVGFRHIMRSQQLLVMANSGKKAPVIKQMLEGNISTNMPASLVRKHNRLIVMLDAEAAHELKGEKSI
jgi:glucosamine-6-phosphate isomerase